MKNLPDKTAQLVEAVISEYAAHQQFVQTALEGLSEQELGELEAYLEFCISKGCDVAYLSECYLTIVEDTLAEQMYFKAHGEYRHSTFQEVADKVYFDPEYMKALYELGYEYGLAGDRWIDRPPDYTPWP